MRFEVVAAFAVGLLLPTLETCRRGFPHWLVDSTTMLEDYLAGALLLFAAAMVQRGRRHASLWMLLAWASVTSMMTISLISQLESMLRGATLEPYHRAVLMIKFLLWGTCMISLVRSFQHAQRTATGSAMGERQG